MIDGCSKPSMDVTARLTRALVRRQLAWIGDWLAEGTGDAETRSAMADILTAHERGDDGAVAGLEEWLTYGPRDLWHRDRAAAPCDDKDGDVVMGTGTVVYVFGDGEAALLDVGVAVALGPRAVASVARAYRGERCIPLSAFVLIGDRVSYGVRRGDLDTGGWAMIGWDERCCGRDTLNLNTVPTPRVVLSRAV